MINDNFHFGVEYPFNLKLRLWIITVQTIGWLYLCAMMLILFRQYMKIWLSKEKNYNSEDKKLKINHRKTIDNG